jgi:2-oxoglutarate dehydrogenase E2 component (dihydrolipoamide succinyltransferase)
MAVDVVMPQMGESIFEGTITKWFKKPGDKVERDEPLFEISTDKVDAEIPAPSAGILREIKVAEGKTVPIQTVVAVIDAAGASATSSAPGAAPAAAATAEAAGPAALKASPAPAPRAAADASAEKASDRVVGHAEPEEEQEEDHQTEEKKAADSPLSSPLVRRLAQENHIDLSMVRGTGAGGRISKKDILAAMAEPAAAPAADSKPAVTPPGGGDPGPAILAQTVPVARPPLESAVPRERIYFGHYQVQPLSVMRQRIAEHMVLSKRVSPHVYSIDEADMTRIARLRTAAQKDFSEKHQTKLTFMPFFVRACVDALRDFPTVNASLDGTNVVLHDEANVGIAVALDWGLIVPVIKHAEEKNFLGLQRAINDLAERARTKKLKTEEVQESTFSITNPGIFGGLMGLPIINQPNVAILGIGAVQKRPVVIDDAIAIRSMVYLTLSYDHRVVDGAVAHQFMGHVKKHLETWTEEIL